MTGEEHRQLQLALRALTLREVTRLWPSFDPTDIRGSWTSLEVALVALIQARSGLSAQLAARYYQSLGGTPALAESVAAADVADTLRIVGPRNAGVLVARNIAPRDIASTTLVNVSGEVTRRVLNAGRDTLTTSMGKDRRVTGYRRVTDGNPCQFCANQAAHTHRAGSHFPAHAHCACFPEPILA